MGIFGLLNSYNYHRGQAQRLEQQERAKKRKLLAQRIEQNLDENDVRCPHCDFKS